MLKKIKLDIKDFFKICFIDVRTDVLFFLGILLLLFWMPIEYGARYINVQTAGEIITGSLILLLFKQKNNFFYKYPLWAISIFWIGVLSLSLLFSSSKLLSMEELLRNLMYISLPIIVFGWADSESRRKLLSYTVIGAGSLVSIIGIAFFLFYYIKTLNMEAAAMPLTRSNDLGAYLLLIFPLALSNFLYEEKRYLDKFLYAFTACLSLVTIIFTFSRGIWLTSIFSVILILIFGFRILKKNIISLVVMGILAFIPIVIKWDSIVNRFLSIQNIFNTSENSIEWRKSLLRGALNMFYDNPIIGSGLNTFSQVFPFYQDTAGYYSINPHNYYLQLLAETGIMGFFTFIILILSILYMSFKAFINSENIFKGISLGLLVGIISSLIHISLDIEWSVSAIPILFWIEVGILISIYGAVGFKETRFTTLSDRFDYIKKPVSFVIAIFLILISFSNYEASILYAKSMFFTQENNLENAKKYNYWARSVLPVNSAKFLNSYSELLVKENKFEEALEFSKKAIISDRYSSNYYKTYSDILMKIDPVKHKDMALETLITAVTYNPYMHPKLYKQVADFYLIQMNKPYEAIKFLKTGASNFPIFNLYNYERFTPDHRYQLYLLYKLLGSLSSKDSPVTSKDYSRVAKFLLETEPETPSTIINKQLSKPALTVKNYWKDIKNKKDTRIYIYKDAKFDLPPKELDFEFIDYINIEHRLFTMNVEYMLSVKNNDEKRNLIVKDILILTEGGWQIFKRDIED
ncbi:MAG: O-antigen ligase family protein [Cyanobacteriota bacterium]